MGVQISAILPKHELELLELSGKKIAIDAYNTIFQFLSIIRDRDTGQPLKDSRGRVTSQLSGLFYRTIRWVEAGIKPVFVFDGEPPKFKKKTIREREARRVEARKKWTEAVREGRKEDIMVYAQAVSELTDDMISESQKLLDAMGIPWIQAPSEGEAQASYLVKKKEAFSVGSQDYDSLLFGSPRLVKNLSITGKRKLPRQEKWIEVKPELFELKNIFVELKINQEQLILVGLLVGTDYNPEGVKGVGPKTALKLVLENKTIDKVLEKIEWKSDSDPYKIFDFFINPPVSNEFEIEMKEPDKEKLFKLMVDEHDFSEERINKQIDKYFEVRKSGTQKGLAEWLKK